MSVVKNTSATWYLRRKKVVPSGTDAGPMYETGTMHPHTKPVEQDPRLDPIDSPANKVKTT